MRGFIWGALYLLTSLASAQGVPWSGGEKLVYQLSWSGIGMGRLLLSAAPAEGGWSFRFKLETTGVASFSGYGLEAESLVGGDFYTDRFWKNLTEPLRGTTRLVFQRDENSGGVAKVYYPDGRLVTWTTPVDQVLDDISLIYYLRLYPQTRQIRAVDYPRLAQGQLHFLGKNPQGLLGYRFAREDVLIEAWYRADARRTPVKVVFGSHVGRIEANLLENAR